MTNKVRFLKVEHKMDHPLGALEKNRYAQRDEVHLLFPTITNA